MHFFLDTVFPPRSNELLVRNISEKKPVITRSDKSRSTVCLSDYGNEVVRALILENKYHQNKNAQIHLASMLQNYLSSLDEEVLLVPIPLGEKRLKERGYNQVENIINNLPKQSIHSANSFLLFRSRETFPQTSLAKIDRLKNMKSAFSCNKKALLRTYKGQTIIIVDDVVTTGATMDAARAELARQLPPSAKIICLALAH